jgi:glycosyltransferase involved in cell wall biosynthesis
MKILHVVQIHWYNAEVQYAWDLAEGMRRRGHEVHALTRRDSLSARKARERGLTVHEEDGFNAKGVRFWKALPAAVRFGRLLDRERYDAVVVHRSEGLPLIARACRKRGVCVVRVRGDMRPVRSDPLNRCVYGRLLSGVVASNRAIEAELKKRIGASLRVKTINGGVDPEAFRPDGPRAGLRAALGLSPDAFLVGILGRMAAHKGYADFIDAAREVLAAQPRAAFAILVKGSLPLLPDLAEKIASDPLLGERVKILGHQEDLAAVLRDFDAAVVASTSSEANCRVGLEWMASGVPLVATRVGTLPDMVEEGVTGFLVPPGSPRELAERIAVLSSNPQITKNMGGAARKSVVERFTLDQVAEAHERFLFEIC